MIPGVDPKVDYMFKRLFGREQNQPVLIDVMDAVLQPPPLEPIDALTYLSPFNEKETEEDKLSIVDVKVRDRKGRQYTVEMQMLPPRSFPQRVVYYWSRLYGQQLKEGDPFQKLQRTVSICFVNGMLFPQTTAYHLCFALRERQQPLVFTNDLEIHILELPKFTKTVAELAGRLDPWLYFLRHADRLDSENLPKPLNTPAIRQAMGELVVVAQNDLERERYEARIRVQRDELTRLIDAREEGLEQGLARGELIGKIHFCQQLLQQSPTPMDQLQTLSADELRQLAQQLEQEVTAKR